MRNAEASAVLMTFCNHRHIAQSTNGGYGSMECSNEKFGRDLCCFENSNCAQLAPEAQLKCIERVYAHLKL